MKHVRCEHCEYVRPDRKASSRKWTALEWARSEKTDPKWITSLWRK